MTELILIACVLGIFALVSAKHILSVKLDDKKHGLYQNKQKLISSDADIREFLSDVTSADTLTLSILEKSFNDPGSVPFLNRDDAYEHIHHSLTKSSQIIEVDWAEGEIAIFDYFQALFELNDVRIPDKIEHYLLQKEKEIKRGDAPELVTALLRASANEAGYEILSLDMDDDQYRFIMAPIAAAQKWENTVLGKSIKIEIPQWPIQSDFVTFKGKNTRRASRSKLVRHLQKQCERACREDDSQQIFSDAKDTLLKALERTHYQGEESTDFLMETNGYTFSIALFDIAAKSLGNNYFVNEFDIKSHALGLYYKMLAPRTVNYKTGLSIVDVPIYVMFSLMGKLTGEKIWTVYADPFIDKVLSNKDGQFKKIVNQFPLMPLLLEKENIAEKAHDLLSRTYNIDTRKEPERLYEEMTKDRIRFTRLLPDLHVSIYSTAPMSFLPLEILYVSTLIEMPLSDDLIVLRDRLSNMPVEVDRGIIALEKYFALSGS